MGLIFLYLGNDVVSEAKDSFEPRQPTHHHQVKMEQTASWKNKLAEILYPANDFLRTRSHLYILFKKAFSNFLMRVGLSGNSISSVFLKNYANSNDWRVTVSICKKIDQEFKQKKIPVLFILIPTSYQVDRTEFEKFARAFGISSDQIDLEQPNKILKQEMVRENLIVIDPLSYFRTLHSQGVKLYGSVDNHLNSMGYYALAKFVIPFIEKELKIK